MHLAEHAGGGDQKGEQWAEKPLDSLLIIPAELYRAVIGLAPGPPGS
jgi:hypothetical protein